MPAIASLHPQRYLGTLAPAAPRQQLLAFDDATTVAAAAERARRCAATDEPRQAATQLQYFLGAHRPHWLAATTQSLFLSHRTLRQRKSLPRARAPWGLDSGGFTELSLYGRWAIAPREYAAAVRRYSHEIGQLAFASQQDHMCEPAILAKTRLTVAQHQERTVDNYLELMSLAPDLPWMPVVQGWLASDYEDHLEMWMRRGVDLARLPRVGVGSICRRESVLRLKCILSIIADHKICAHAFGLKVAGLHVAGGFLASADSMAWSFAARRENREDGWRLQERRTGRQNRLECAHEWFDDRIQPILDGGFCPQTGYSWRYLGEDARDAALRASEAV